jgi:hypothetical protein
MERRGSYRVLVGNTEGKRPIGRPGIILKCIFRSRIGGAWTGLSWLRIRKCGGHL